MFFHVVSLSNSSLEPRLRRNSMVTGECCSVNRKLESTISGSLFFSGTRLVFVDLLSVVPWCRGCKCGRGGRPVVHARVRLSSFCEVILVSLRFCLCIDDVV